MSNLGSSLSIGLSGLQSAQEAMNVVGHNIANVNTPDYSQQSAVLTTNPDLNYGNNMFGTGVTVASVQAMRNQFLNLQVTQSLSAQSGAEARSDGVQAVSSAFQDDGTTGLNTQMQAFYSSLSSLATNPSDVALRQAVVGSAQAVVSEFQSTNQTVQDQITSENQQVASLVPQINTLTAQIATLNTQISQQVNPETDNDAIDQRQALTDQLGKLTGIQVSTNSLNQYTISLDSGAATLVSGGESYQMAATPDPANNNLLAVSVVTGTISTAVTGSISGGQLGGALDLRDTILPGYQSQLDTIAGSFVGQMNKANMAGYSLPNAAGTSTTGNLLFTGTGINAATGLANTDAAGKPVYTGIINSLTVNTDPTLIGAAATAGDAGDNTNATIMANLQNAPNTVDTTGNGVYVAGSTTGGVYTPASFTGGTGPFSTAVSSLVNAVGTQAQDFSTTATNQENLTTALQTQQTSVSGVDLDQSAAQLLSYQQAYQASAQFISTISQLTTQLMTAMSAAGA